MTICTVKWMYKCTFILSRNWVQDLHSDLFFGVEGAGVWLASFHFELGAGRNAVRGEFSWEQGVACGVG